MRLGPMVLVVDRDDAVRGAMCDLLSIENYRTTCVAEVSDAAEAIDREVPAVVLLCWDVSADTASKRALIEQVPRASSIILMSTSPDAQVEAADCNLPFLSKPFRVSEFLAKVAEGVRRSPP